MWLPLRCVGELVLEDGDSFYVSAVLENDFELFFGGLVVDVLDENGLGVFLLPGVFGALPFGVVFVGVVFHLDYERCLFYNEVEIWYGLYLILIKLS